MNPRQDIERAIVASVLARGEQIDVLRDRLNLSDFSSSRCRAILASVMRLRARNHATDPISVKSELEARGEFDAAGGAAFFAALEQSAPDNGRVEFLIERLPELPAPGEADLPEVGEDINRTDVGAARALVALHGRGLRHVHGEGWRVWDGSRWTPDTTGEVISRAKATAEALLHAAVEISDRTVRTAAVRWALGCHSQKRLAAMVSLAASEPGIAVTREAFDRDKMAFNVLNGTIDLRTGQRRPPRRTDLLSKQAPVAFQPEATCPKWIAFLQRIFAGSQELIGFVQRAAGYALSGDTSEQVIFMLYGTGANGKSTLLRVLIDMMGDYGCQGRSEVILIRHRGDRERDNELARLCGSRFVAIVEIQEGRRLAEGLVKQLSGGDRVGARQVYERAFDFDPQFKLFLAVNHRPVVKGTDLAIWRRIRLLPFDVAIPPAEQDRHLADALRSELSGILNWALAGCLAWQKEGLCEPPEVMAATDSYRREMDIIGAFIEQECVQGDGLSVSKGTFYQSYRDWCHAQGEEALRQQEVGRRLLERGTKDGRSGARGRFWVSIGLASDRER